MARNESEYKRRQEGNATIFEVTPAARTKYWYAVVFGGIVGLLGLLAGLKGLFFVLLGFGLASLGWTIDVRPKASRQPAVFKVTADAIEAGPRVFKKAEIHRLIVKNSITDKELPGFSTYTDNSHVAAGMRFRAKASMIANTLNVESGGKSTLLAGGMDPTTAHGLLTDVSRVLGFSAS